MRGFHILMRALPIVLKKRSNARVIIVGGNEVSYGHRAPDGQTWKEALLAELGDQIDLNRVFFPDGSPTLSIWIF